MPEHFMVLIRTARVSLESSSPSTCSQDSGGSTLMTTAKKIGNVRSKFSAEPSTVEQAIHLSIFSAQADND